MCRQEKPIKGKMPAAQLAAKAKTDFWWAFMHSKSVAIFLSFCVKMEFFNKHQSVMSVCNRCKVVRKHRKVPCQFDAD